MSGTIQRIVETAKAKGVKQAHLASAIGGYSSKITEWKNGKSTPTDQEILIIAKELGVSFAYLKLETDDPSPGQEKEAPRPAQKDRDAREIYEKISRMNGGSDLTPKQVHALLVFLENMSNYIRLVMEKNRQ